MERPNLHQKQKMAKATLTKDIEVLDKLLHVQHKQLESALFILWRHVEYYLSAAPNKPQVWYIFKAGSGLKSIFNAKDLTYKTGFLTGFISPVFWSFSTKFVQSILFGSRSSELSDSSMSRKELKELRLGLAASMNEAILKRLCDAETQYFQLGVGNLDFISDITNPCFLK